MDAMRGNISAEEAVLKAISCAGKSSKNFLVEIQELLQSLNRSGHKPSGACPSKDKLNQNILK